MKVELRTYASIHLARNTRLKHKQSIYKGVSWDHSVERWRAHIGDGHFYSAGQQDLGSFESELEAAHAYDDYLRNHPQIGGKFNFPEGNEESAFCRKCYPEGTQ